MQCITTDIYALDLQSSYRRYVSVLPLLLNRADADADTNFVVLPAVIVVVVVLLVVVDDVDRNRNRNPTRF